MLWQRREGTLPPISMELDRVLVWVPNVSFHAKEGHPHGFVSKSNLGLVAIQIGLPFKTTAWFRCSHTGVLLGQIDGIKPRGKPGPYIFLTKQPKRTPSFPRFRLVEPFPRPNRPDRAFSSACRSACSSVSSSRAPRQRKRSATPIWLWDSQHRFGIPFWWAGEFTTHFRLPILVVGLNRMFTGG